MMTTKCCCFSGQSEIKDGCYGDHLENCIFNFFSTFYWENFIETGQEWFLDDADKVTKWLFSSVCYGGHLEKISLNFSRSTGRILLKFVLILFRLIRNSRWLPWHLAGIFFRRYWPSVGIFGSIENARCLLWLPYWIYILKLKLNFYWAGFDETLCEWSAYGPTIPENNLTFCSEPPGIDWTWTTR